MPILVLETGQCFLKLADLAKDLLIHLVSLRLLLSECLELVMMGVFLLD